LSWLVQVTYLVPSVWPSTLKLSVSGHRLQGLAVGPNGFGFLAALVVVVAFCAASSRAIWIARGIAVLSLLASDSRTAFLAMSAGLLLFWVLGPGWPLSRRVLTILGASVATPIAWLYIDVERRANSNVLTGRPQIWAVASSLARHVGLLGDGPEAIARLFPNLLGPYSQVSQAQNQWINDAINFGYFESALLALLLLSIILTRQRDYRQAILVPLIGMVLVESISEIPIDLWASIVPAFPFFVLLMFSPRLGRRRAPNSEPGLTRRSMNEEKARVAA
jgi:hypothetical protein